MRAVALAYAQDSSRSPMPTEILMARMIDRYGVQAVLHRDYIGAGEAFAMNAAENIVNAYKSRAQAENWATWAQEHPDLNRLLMSVELENGE